MKRLTKWIEGLEQARISCKICGKTPIYECWSQENCTQTAVDRLAAIEDILGDDYDLDRLRELAEADMAGRCVVLPVKPGETVRFARNPRAKHEKVACVTLYEGGKIRLGFHDVGYKETWVDEWSEDDAENYVLAEKEAGNP